MGYIIILLIFPHPSKWPGQLRDADKAFSVAGASLMFPRDPAGPAAETVNRGCQSLPWMESWEVQNPGRKAFSEEEIARNPIRAPA